MPFCRNLLEMHCIHEARGSIPLSSTRKIKGLDERGWLFFICFDTFVTYATGKGKILRGLTPLLFMLLRNMEIRQGHLQALVAQKLYDVIQPPLV
jgi:hypothetical protein